jgi:serine/threonine-protein kinase
LGAIWHQALLGEPVFKGAVPEETLRLHLEQPPTPPREKDPRLSAATSGLIVRLLEKDRDARPRTPAEFLRRLAEHPLFAETENPVGPMATPVEEIVSQP